MLTAREPRRRPGDTRAVAFILTVFLGLAGLALARGLEGWW